MSNIVLHSRSGADSKLHLEIPVDRPDTEFEVEVAVRAKTREDRGWPPGYFDLFGAIDDETLIVHPQPQLPPPVALE